MAGSTTKTWYLNRRDNGKVRQVKLGTFPEMNVERARMTANGTTFAPVEQSEATLQDQIRRKREGNVASRMAANGLKTKLHMAERMVEDLQEKLDHLTKMYNKNRRDAAGCACLFEEDGETYAKRCSFHAAVETERNQLREEIDACTYDMCPCRLA